MHWREHSAQGQPPVNASSFTEIRITQAPSRSMMRRAASPRRSGTSNWPWLALDLQEFAATGHFVWHDEPIESSIR